MSESNIVCNLQLGFPFKVQQSVAIKLALQVSSFYLGFPIQSSFYFAVGLLVSKPAKSSAVQ